MDRDDVQRLGLDADDYVDALRQVVRANTDAQKSAEDFLSTFVKYDKAGDVAEKGFTKLIDGLGKLSVSLKEVDGYLEVQRVSFRKNNDEQQAYVENAKRNLRTLQQAKRDASRAEETERQAYAENARRNRRSELQAAREAQQEADTLQRNKEIAIRAAARAGGSFGGSGSFSFTSLGSVFGGPGGPGLPKGVGLGELAGGFAAGAAAGVAAAAIGSIVSQLKTGAEEAEKFQLQIARIRAIQVGAAQSTREWSDALFRLSGTYNIDAVDVAKAAYKGLSTQMVKSAGDTRLLEESLKLARTTGTDASTTMQAISSVINSYGLAAEDGSKVSELLFNTVRLGNIDMSELGSGIGRVTSLAAPMGVKLEEVAAALETLKSKGISTDQSLAGLAQLLAEFERPNKATQEAFQGLGVGSGQQAIAIYGLVGALQKLNEQTIKQGHGIEELFPNIRGLRTDFLLTADGVKAYDEKLKQARESTGALETANNRVREASGQLWAQMSRDVDNVFTDLGKRVNDIKDAFAAVHGYGETASAGKPVVGAAAEKARKAAGYGSDVDVFTNSDGEYTFVKHVQDVQSATNDAFRAQYEKRMGIVREANAKLNALAKDEVDALRENGKSYIEELKRRTEATKRELFNQDDSFNKSRFNRALKLANPRESQELIEGRLKLLSSQEDTKLSELQGLHGKAFLDSKNPEEIKKLYEEILAIKTQQVEKVEEEVTKGLASRRQLQDAEDDLTKTYQKQQEVLMTVAQLTDEREKSAERQATRQKQYTADTERVAVLQAAIQKGKQTPEMAMEYAQILKRLESVIPQQGKLEAFGPSTTTAGPGIHGSVAQTSDIILAGEKFLASAKASYDMVAARDAARDAYAATYAAQLVSSQSRLIASNDRLAAALGLPAGRISVTKGGEGSFERSVRAMLAVDDKLPGFAGGGLASSDTIPAMLSPGEFVVNRAATGMFYPILRAMNDRTIRGFAEGGSVTNMGDINITVRGGETSQQTLYEITRGLQKAIRRGTFKP